MNRIAFKKKKDIVGFLQMCVLWHWDNKVNIGGWRAWKYRIYAQRGVFAGETLLLLLRPQRLHADWDNSAKKKKKN